MNQFVRSWQRHAARTVAGPDSITLDFEDEKVTIPMANRKAPETKPVVNADEKKTSKEAAKDLRTSTLNEIHFNSVVHHVKTASLDRVESLRNMTYTALKRLGVRRNKKKAVVGIPKASKNFDTGTFKTWLESIDPKDKEAVAQVVAIDATCVARWS